MNSRGCKSGSALRTIGEVSKIVDLPSYVIRFWEGSFSKLKPLKYNNRRYYTLQNIELLKQIKDLLYNKGYTIKGAAVYINSPISKVSFPSLEETMSKLINARNRLSDLLK